MNLDKWKDIVGSIKDKFEVIEYEKEHYEEQGGLDLEYIVFNSPLGRVKLEFISKPVVLDKKTNYSRRIGSDVKVEYVYSEEEMTTKMEAYKWDESSDDWIKIDGEMFKE
jgi:hypothetical protein